MSIQSEITRITNNVQDTIDVIEQTGVSVPDGANSDNLPSLAQALANEKQDKLTGQQGQYVGFDSNGAAVATSKPTYTASEVGARPSTWTPTASEVGAIPATEKGAASGVATLGTDGKLTAAQKPAYTASEVGARPSTWTPSAADVGAVPTTRTINSKPLSSNVTLTAEDVGAIANPNSGTTGQILTKTENGEKWADPPSGGTASYVASFTAEQWTAGTGESTITIPAATHKLSGSIVDCKAFASISGGYRAGVWASLETYATVAENGDIVLHNPDTSGYAGAAVLTAYEIPS